MSIKFVPRKLILSSDPVSATLFRWKPGINRNDYREVPAKTREQGIGAAQEKSGDPIVIGVIRLIR